MSEEIKIEEISKNTIVDTATIITISGILLYQLGWSYWETYFNCLNIDSSFIEISIEKIISTTWTTIILVFLVLLRSIEDVLKLKPKETISAFNVFLYIFFGVALMYFANNTNNIDIYDFMVFIISVVFLSFFEKTINKLGNVTRRNYIIILFIAVYIISAFYYPYVAKRDSHETLSDYTNNIEIELNHDNKIIKGKFVTFMGDKYFILIENSKCQRETIVINNNEVFHSKFLTKINK